MKHLLFIIVGVVALLGCSGNLQRGAGEDSAPDSVKVVETVEVSSKESSDTALFVSRNTVNGVLFIILKMNSDVAYVTMADSVIPNREDPSIFLCVEAAFTGELLKQFKSTNVVGNYVIDGNKKHGYNCRANTGNLFADHDGCVVISSNRYCSDQIKVAQSRGGSLFQQMMLIYAGKKVYKDTPVKLSSKNIFRAACCYPDNEGFAIVQSEKPLALADFIAALQKLGFADALYLDMGRGWNYGWYRQTSDCPATNFFNYKSPYQTNWLVIKKKSKE